jgi:hypothetical protein
MRQFCAKKLVKKNYFYCNGEALKVFRIYRCHPVYTALTLNLALYMYIVHVQYCTFTYIHINYRAVKFKKVLEN